MAGAEGGQVARARVAAALADRNRSIARNSTC